jgi:hypothetical protein
VGADVSRPHWECSCGDAAPAETETEALCGAGAHWLRREWYGRCRVTGAYAADGTRLVVVESASEAMRVRNRYLSSAGSCCCDYGPGAGWCECREARMQRAADRLAG